jgi:hypothetical protein
VNSPFGPYHFSSTLPKSKFLFNFRHRKLLDIFKDIPELSLLAKHYNPKIRSLVNELKKDLNKAEYLDIEKFSKIDCKKMT